METLSSQNTFLKKEKYLASLLIIFVAVVAYVPLMSSFGYYLDDWYVVWAGRVFGPEMIAELHKFDRPLMGVFYSLYYRIWGTNLMGWQIFILILRLIGALSFFQILRLLWPKQLLATTSAALLFVIYPGFLQQPNAILFSNFIFSLTSALVSILFSVLAVMSTRTSKVVYFQSLSALFAVTYLFYIEFMVGLEFFRWAFLWIGLVKLNEGLSLKKRIIKWLQHVLPTFMITLGMIGWRIFIFDSGRRSMNVNSIIGNFTGSLSHSIIGLFVETGRDFIETAFSTWFVPAYQMSAGASYRNWSASMFFAIIAVIIYLGYVKYIKRASDVVPSNGEQKRYFLWIGVIGVLALLLPVVAVGRQVYLDLIFNGFNRYTLHVSVGVSVLIVGLLQMGTRRAGFVGIMTLLIASAIYTHYFNGLRYQSAWEYQKELWWQVAWRVPDLKDDTVLTSMLPPEFPFVESTQLWAPANIIYRPDSKRIAIKGEILNTETIGKFQRGISDEKNIRGIIPMPRDYDNTLIITIPDSLSCVHVIDGNNLEDYREHLLIQLISEKSQIEQIIIESESDITPPIDVFGPEPDHEWCYFYQKISLARQRGEWGEVVKLADQVSDLGFKPLNRSEWIPVFEAYVNVNRMQDAEHLATIIKDDKDLKFLYCTQSHKNEVAYSLICSN